MKILVLTEKDGQQLLSIDEVSVQREKFRSR